MDNKSESTNRPKRQRISKPTEDQAPLLPMGEAPAVESTPEVRETAAPARPAKNIRPRKGKPNQSDEAPI